MSDSYMAQTGGRKRERRSHHRGSLFKRTKSGGHADQFAKGTGRRGLFARLFKKEKPSWTNHRSGSRRSHHRDNRSLFGRYRTKGKQYNADTQDRQNRERSRKRIRGNKVFSRKKY